jgi:hypothetical protein
VGRQEQAEQAEMRAVFRLAPNRKPSLGLCSLRGIRLDRLGRHHALDRLVSNEAQMLATGGFWTGLACLTGEAAMTSSGLSQSG